MQIYEMHVWHNEMGIKMFIKLNYSISLLFVYLVRKKILLRLYILIMFNDMCIILEFLSKIYQWKLFSGVEAHYLITSIVTKKKMK